MKYEYKTLVLTGGFMGRHKEELHRSALDKQLAVLGQEGWELCWTLMDQALQGEKDGHVLIFKRASEILSGFAASNAVARCRGCGQELAEDTRFCGSCGNPTGA